MTANQRIAARLGPKADRAAFWGYCKRAEHSARNRADVRHLPCEIDAHFIDRLLVDQGWLCAVSRVSLTAPGDRSRYSKDPFAPSLDRIVPSLGYVPGNVRIVANIVNSAMSEWGLDNLMILIEAMNRRSP